MNREDFFTGRTEKFLIEKLKEQGKLTAAEVFSVYSSPSSAQTFMQKLITFNMAKLTNPGEFAFIIEENNKEDKNERRID